MHTSVQFINLLNWVCIPCRANQPSAFCNRLTNRLQPSHQSFATVSPIVCKRLTNHLQPSHQLFATVSPIVRRAACATQPDQNPMSCCLKIPKATPLLFLTVSPFAMRAQEVTEQNLLYDLLDAELFGQQKLGCPVLEELALAQLSWSRWAMGGTGLTQSVTVIHFGIWIWTSEREKLKTVLCSCCLCSLQTAWPKANHMLLHCPWQGISIYLQQRLLKHSAYIWKQHCSHTAAFSQNLLMLSAALCLMLPFRACLSAAA